MLATSQIITVALLLTLTSLASACGPDFEGRGDEYGAEETGAEETGAEETGAEETGAEGAGESAGRRGRS